MDSVNDNLKTNKTLVFLVLDRSGSMESSRAETIVGVNTYMDKLKEDKDGDYRATLLQFDAHNGPQLLLSYENTPVADVPALDTATYQPRGYTPLYDAIGESVRRAKPEDDRSVTMVIVTDGMENASGEFTQESVKRLITEKEAAGWTFVFLGANIDAYQVGASIGTQYAATANYDPARTGQTYTVLAQSTMARTHLNSTRGVRGAMGMSFFSDSQKAAMGDTATPDPNAATQTVTAPSTWITTVASPYGGTPSTVGVPVTTVSPAGGGPAAGIPFRRPAAKRPGKGMVRKPRTGGKGWTVTVPDGK